MKARYSGSKSRKFWKRVGRLDKNEWRGVYELGCALQDLEDRVLAALQAAERK